MENNPADATFSCLFPRTIPDYGYTDFGSAFTLNDVMIRLMPASLYIVLHFL